MTGITSNIDGVIQRFKDLSNKMHYADVSDALVAGVNAARGEMSNRIFNQGKDTAGQSLGKYKGKKKKVDAKKLFKKKKRDFLAGTADEFSPYELKRIRKGRQVRYKDLEFEGALRRGIVVIKETSQRVVCAIPNDKLLLIAQGQEEQLNTTIFGLSKEERETMDTNIKEALKQYYDRIFNP